MSSVRPAAPARSRDGHADGSQVHCSTRRVADVGRTGARFGRGHLDTDNQLELILRSRHLNEKGESSDETFEVMARDENGNFVKGKEQIANKESYVFMEIDS